MYEIYASPDDDLQQLIDGLTQPATIYLKSGTYRQKLKICRDDIKLVGENRETTVITYDDYAKKIHADGSEYNTFRTYTLLITGERVCLNNLTVENSNTNPETVGQCVALSVNAKTFSAENINLFSTQDTLYLAPFPDDLVIRYRDFLPADELYMQGSSLHLFKNCRIAGTVDFIFGGAEAYFLNCRIESLKDKRKIGFIAAPCHSLKQEKGFCFVDCNIVSRGAEDDSVYLARPWRDFGKCVFLNCDCGKHVKAELFDKWNDTERDKTARFYYGGCKFENPPRPVEWAKQIEDERVKTIIKESRKKFNTV